jgi:DNA-binding response OmpR family regulator
VDKYVQMKRRILIVNDEPDINLALKITLQDGGFKVGALDDPLLALESFKHNVYHLLILDVKIQIYLIP